MYSIVLNNQKKDFDNKSFLNEIIEICDEHKKNHRALAFAFILYDFENPQVRSMLDKDEYWDALNQLSGKYLTVFSINYRKNKRKIIPKNTKQYMTSITVPIDKEEIPDLRIEKIFKETFKINYPALLFFQIKDDEIIDSFFIELKEKYLEKSFEEIKEYLRKGVDALKILNENDPRYAKEIFEYMKTEIETTKFIKLVQIGTSKIIKFLPLVNYIINYLKIHE